MTEKITMPKNVQSFVDKYGGIGSKEQNSAFWKEFRKAANAYANVQAKRICDLEHALAEERKHRNKIEDKLRVDLRGHPDSELLGDAGLIAATTRCVDALDTVTEQQDEYKAALQSADNHNHEIATKLEIVTEQRDRLAEALRMYGLGYTEDDLNQLATTDSQMGEITPDQAQREIKRREAIQSLTQPIKL